MLAVLRYVNVCVRVCVCVCVGLGVIWREEPRSYILLDSLF
jgi:hypothetical protein